jgi:hypothetical protein
MHRIYGYIIREDGCRERAGNLFPVFGFTCIDMQRSFFFGLCLIVCAAVLAAGCTTTSGTQGAKAPDTAVTVSSANVSLAPLILTPADVPAGFNLVTSREKSANEVGSLAKDLGWQQGYVVIYSSPSNGSSGPSAITQSITVYPADQMSGIVTLVNTNERQINGLDFSDLPLPATGPKTCAFSATVSKKTPTPATTSRMSVISSDSGSSAPTEGYLEVVFAQGNILEVIRMSGPGAQYETLKNLSETAYAKLG